MSLPFHDFYTCWMLPNSSPLLICLVRSYMLELSVEQAFKRACIVWISEGTWRSQWWKKTDLLTSAHRPSLTRTWGRGRGHYGTFRDLSGADANCWWIMGNCHWFSLEKFRSDGIGIKECDCLGAWTLFTANFAKTVVAQREAAFNLPLRFKSFYIFQQSSWVSILSIAHALEAVASRGCGRSAIEASFCWLQGEHKNAEVMQPCAVMCSKISWIMLDHVSKWLAMQPLKPPDCLGQFPADCGGHAAGLHEASLLSCPPCFDLWAFEILWVSKSRPNLPFSEVVFNLQTGPVRPLCHRSEGDNSSVCQHHKGKFIVQIGLVARMPRKS